MAKSAWGIELGTSSVKAVKISDDRGSITLEAISIIDLADFGLGAGTLVEQATTAALNQLRNSHGIKRGDQVFVSINGQNTLGRIISLPPVDKDQIRETIENEARSQIPIKLDEAVWDYQVIEDDGDDEIKVNLYAAKREAVDEVVSICESAGIAATGIQVAPLGLYNYVKYEFDDDVSDSCVAIDIGADNTDVVIIDGQKTYVRNLAVAGNDITRALRARFKLSQEDAEKLKKRAAKSKDAAAVFEAMKPPLKEMVGEIYRAVGFYKNQHEDANINQLVLMGNGAKLLNIKKFFEQQLQYTCHKLDTPSRIALSRSVDPSEVQSNIHSLAVAIGLGLQGVEVPGVNYINLIPAGVLESREKEKLKTPFIVGGVLAALGGVVALVMGITAGGGVAQDLGTASETKKIAAERVSEFTTATGYDDGISKELSLRNLTEGEIGSIEKKTKNDAGDTVKTLIPLTISAKLLPLVLIRRVDEGIAQYNENSAEKRIYVVNYNPVDGMTTELSGNWGSNLNVTTGEDNGDGSGTWVKAAEGKEGTGYWTIDRKYKLVVFLGQEKSNVSSQESLRSKLEKAFVRPSSSKLSLSSKETAKDKSLIQGPIEAEIMQYLKDSGQLKGLPKDSKFSLSLKVAVVKPIGEDALIDLKNASDAGKIMNVVNGSERKAESPKSSSVKNTKMFVVQLQIEVTLTGARKPVVVEEDQ